jgi:hypothetical protein
MLLVLPADYRIEGTSKNRIFLEKPGAKSLDISL